MTGARLQWASSDSSILAIDQAGTITGQRFGGATAVASADGVRGTARIQVLAALQDSTRVSATDSVHLTVGAGYTATVPPSAAAAGQSVLLEERAAGGTTNALGPSLVLSIGSPGSPGGASMSTTPTSVATAPLLVSVSTVTAPPPGPPPPQGILPVNFLLSGAGSGATTTSPILLAPSTVQSMTSGTGAPKRLSTISWPLFAGSTLVVSPIAAPPPCQLLDSQRLYRVRQAPTTAAPAPALVLVHGWQAFQSNCGEAAAFDPTSETWKTFLTGYLPISGLSLEPRLAAFDVWVVRYPTFDPIQTNGDDLARLLQLQLPGRHIAVLAHSMGGLVTAAALLRNNTLPIHRIVALGTPWRGTPFGRGWVTLNPAASQCFLPGPGAPALAFRWLIMPGQGGRDLSDEPAGYLNKVLRSTIDNPVALRTTVIRGDIRTPKPHFDFGNPLTVEYQALDFGDCVLRNLNPPVGPSDGVVTTSSASADGTIQDVTTADGLDHVTLLEYKTSKVDPLGVAVDRLLSFLDQYAPVASVKVLPTAVTVPVGQAVVLRAELRDVTGALLSRPVQWASSDASIASVDAASGRVQGLRVGGPVSIVATVDGESGSSQVTVTAGGPPTGALLTIQTSWLPVTSGDSSRVSVFGWADTAATGGDRRLGILRWANARSDSIPTGDQHKYPEFGAITRCPDGKGYAIDLEYQRSGPGGSLWRVDLTTGELSNRFGFQTLASIEGVALTCDANNRLVIGDKFSGLRIFDPQTGRLEQNLISMPFVGFRGIAESPTGVLYATVSDLGVAGYPMYLAIVNRTTGVLNPVRAGQYLGVQYITDLMWFGPRLFGVARIGTLLSSDIVEIDPVAGTARIVRPIRF